MKRCFLKYWTCTGLVLLFTLYNVSHLYAEEKRKESEVFEARMKLYQTLAEKQGLKWQWIAAIDQYERTLTKAKPKQRPTQGTITSIYIDQRKWVGQLNPNSEETSSSLIEYFNGIGRDGNGDGKAELNNDTDLLYSITSAAANYGTRNEDFEIGLWEYYQNARAVQRIKQFKTIYENYNQLDLSEHAFPLPVNSIYSYRSTWGDRRGWGGKRIHEGTDIFANYGTDVRSTCYGIIEIKGWNRYGGWRIGIRDLDNHYHYFAHLQGFAKDLEIGQTVKPGEVIGWVGSSGYGKIGTSGKFPPHLHYGMYSDRGYIEWAFDPFPSLKHWEQLERKKLRR